MGWSPKVNLKLQPVIIICAIDPGLKPPAVIGVPVASVQKTTLRTFTVEGEEKNEGLHPHMSWTKNPDFLHVYRGI
jgi:hypothetical protein